MTETTTATAEAPAEQPDAAAEPEEQATIPTTDEVPEPEGTVSFAAPTGSLDLTPQQTKLSPDQKAALAAITNADPSLERTWPHLRTFLHVCQKMDLDPWRKQAYLIARGEGDKQKFTIQVGIDGYRTIAARTRLLIGSATWLWTGTDDDDSTWRFNEATGVMQRVWYDEWPESRGYPGAAKAVIRSYDAFGNVIVSDAVAHWGMYAPLYPKFDWTGPSGQRRKVPVMGDDGKQVIELSEMWAKGYHHMLAKCAEALVLRKVFPDEFAGTVTFEEMHRADMEERKRIDREAAVKRKEAFRDAKARQQGTTTPAEPTAEPAADAEAKPPEEPTGDAQPAAAADEPVADAAADEDTQRAWWLTEIAWQAEQMDTTTAALAKRFVKARRQNVEDFPLDALATVVHGFRPLVVERLKQNKQTAEAERYAAYATDEAPTPISDLDAVLNGSGDDAGEPEPDAQPTEPEPAAVVAGEPAEPAAEADPAGEPEPGKDSAEEPTEPPAEAAVAEEDGPHAFVKAKGRNPGPECQAPGCGFYADDPIHTVPDLEAGGQSEG